MALCDITGGTIASQAGIKPKRLRPRRHCGNIMLWCGSAALLAQPPSLGRRSVWVRLVLAGPHDRHNPAAQKPIVENQALQENDVARPGLQYPPCRHLGAAWLMGPHQGNTVSQEGPPSPNHGSPLRRE